MAVRRVYLIWTHPLFHETVRLLLQGAGIELVGASSDRATAQEDIAEMNPDVVIMESSTEVEDSQDKETVAILRSGSQVIRLSMSHNELSLYTREHLTVRNAADLLRLVTGEHGEHPSREGSHGG